MNRCYFSLLFLVSFIRLFADQFPNGIPVDNETGRVVFTIPFSHGTYTLPIQLIFDSGRLEEGGAFNSLWFFDIEKSNLYLSEKNILKWTHRYFSKTELKKKSDGRFTSNGWEALVQGRNNIEIQERNNSKFSFLFKNGRLVKEKTPLSHTEIFYHPRDTLIEFIKNSDQDNTISFSYKKHETHRLLHKITDKHSAIEFKYSKFNISDKAGLDISTLLLSEINMPEKKIVLNYSVILREDETYNVLKITYSWTDFEFSKEIEWNAKTGKLNRVDSRFL